MDRSPLETLARSAAKAVFSLRIPANPLHRALAWEYQLRTFGMRELARILYFQPMFESRCARVEPGLRLEVVPTSQQPSVANVQLEVGREVRLSARTTFSGARNAPRPPRIVLGDHCYVGHGVVLRAGLSIHVGQHVLIASSSLLSSDPGHPLDAQARRTEPAPASALGHIVLEDDVWVAYGAAILGNVRVGRGAVIAAHAVVTRDVPPYALVAGNPARVVRTLTPKERERTSTERNEVVRLPEEWAPPAERTSPGRQLSAAVRTALAPLAPPD